MNIYNKLAADTAAGKDKRYGFFYISSNYNIHIDCRRLSGQKAGAGAGAGTEKPE